MTAIRFADYVAAQYADPLDVLAAHLDDATAAAAGVGAKLGDLPQLDGARHYLPNLAGKNEQRHYYRGSIEADADGTVWPCVTFGTFKGGSAKVFWKPRDRVWREYQGASHNARPAPARAAEYKRRADALLADQVRRAAKREAEEAKGDRAAADAAAAIWAAAEPCTAHAYTAVKGVTPVGLRVATSDYRARLYSKDAQAWRNVAAARAGDLLIPMVDADGMLWGLQRIDAVGGKRFIMGSRKRGLFHRIDGNGRAWLAEGYATGATVHAATGAAVIVAFDAGNLVAVANALAGQVEAVAADNDENGAGRKGAEATGLPCLFPPAFGDWNDHAARFGLGSVAALLQGTAASRASTPSPNRDETRRRMQQEENARIQEPEAVNTVPPALSLSDMRDSLVWIANGEMVAHVKDPSMVLKWHEFRSLTSASVTFGENRKKPVPTAVAWQQDPERKTVMTRTFRAGAGIFCRDPDGAAAINTWRPTDRQSVGGDPTLFLEHVVYLFRDEGEREKFLDWLAHLEQRPGELPHYGWLHVADHTGTGRNWLASVLARVWRGYVAPNIDLPSILDSQYNGQLAGRLLAIVDEAQEAAGERRYSHINKLRSLVNAEFRDVNPKYGRQHREHNSCRWLVFSNHLNALPIDDRDRRWRVVHHSAKPRPVEDYGRLYAALSDPSFIDAVGVYLASRDIGAFNPGERPPMNAAKLAVVGTTKTMAQLNADMIAAKWPVDVITTNDIAAALSDGAEDRFTPAMRRAMEEVGALAIDRPIKVNGTARRCWIVRNPAKWLAADSGAIAQEVRRVQPHGSGTWCAVDVLADAHHDREHDEPF